MKIIIVVPEFGLAGAETMVENLVYNLNRKKNSIILVSLFDYKSPITERLEAKGIKIFYLGKKKGLDFTMVKKLSRIFKNEKPDVIHTHRYVLEYVVPANIISGNCKIIHTVHNIATKEVNKSQRLLQRFFFKHFNVTPVAISELIKESIIKEYGLSEKNVPVILNGIDLSNCIQKRDYKKNHIILNIGRFAEQKNQLFLIDIFAKIHKLYPDYKLKIIGNGPLYEDLLNKIQKMDLADSIIIEKDKPSCFKDLNEADIFVMPSLWEGVPMTIIEALGTGLPIVASNVGGIPNMLENNKNGILSKLELDDFVNNICMLIDDEKLRQKIGKQALLNSKRFTAKEMAEKYFNLYKGTKNN